MSRITVDGFRSHHDTGVASADNSKNVDFTAFREKLEPSQPYLLPGGADSNLGQGRCRGPYRKVEIPKGQALQRFAKNLGQQASPNALKSMISGSVR